MPQSRRASLAAAAAFLCTSLVSAAPPSALPASSVAALRAAVASTTLDAAACVLFTHAHGTAGCAGVVSRAALGGTGRNASALVAPGADLVPLLTAAAAAGGGSAPFARAPFPAVAVSLPGPPPPSPWSPDEPNPQAAWAPAPAPPGWEWVPGGCGALAARLPFLAFDLYGAGPAAAAAGRAAENDGDGGASRAAPRSSMGVHAADADVRMNAAGSAGGGGRGSTPAAAAAAAAATNTTACLAAGTCQPVGGHSVWAAIGRGAGSGRAATVLLAAAADARSLGRGRGGAGGAGSAGRLSGLVALLAAAEVLGNASRSGRSGGGNPIIVAALAGEAWGFLGSGRLLFEANTDATRLPGTDGAGGFPASSITHLLELGPVGDGKEARLFAHPATKMSGGGGGARDDPAAAALVSASPTAVSLPPPGAPGPPPSSSWALAPRLPGLVGAAVLTAHAATLGGPAWASRWDDALDAGATARAAAAAATAAAALAGWGGGPLAAPDPALLAARVRDLAACVLGAADGCSTAAALLGSAGAAALAADAPFAHLGPLATVGPDPQAPPVVSSGARFLWEALARAAAAAGGGGGGGESPGEEGPPRPCKSAGGCERGEVCAGVDAGAGGKAGTGACTPATVRFVAAYPVGLECTGCADGGGQWGAWAGVQEGSSPAAAWAAATAWPAEPLWCESVWPAGGVPSLALYRSTPPGAAGRALVAGVVATGVAVWAGRAARREFGRVA